MKLTEIRAGVLLITIVIGCVSVLAFLTASSKSFGNVEASRAEVLVTNQLKRQEITAEIEKRSPLKAEYLEERNRENFDGYLIDLLQVGEFHGEEVEAKSGEKWLGLFNEDGKSFLAWTTLQVTAVKDEIADSDTDQMTGKKVSVNQKTTPIFLLKNADGLRSEKVITLFDARKIPDEEWDSKTNLNNGFETEFILRETKFVLKVVNEKTKEKSISEGSKLIIESGGIAQVVHPQEGGRFGDSWTLHWVGDLDNDGKLDFFADLSDHYNVTARILFLSSSAEEGDLVKDVAGKRTVGC
ncbi:MAG: hypothetical protein HKN25_15135 [Pyrinomonadaceae bacterium]|nr:hypothetical protein [Pyrinomonadaceae bacterium]